MALKLNLKPGEKVAVNGAVIVNGDRRSSMVIENHASVLRERDIMQPAEASTPAKRIYFEIMLLYLDPAGAAGAAERYKARLEEFAGAVSTPTILETCATLAAHVANGEHYKALTQCRKLIEFEKTRLADVA